MTLHRSKLPFSEDVTQTNMANAQWTEPTKATTGSLSSKLSCQTEASTAAAIAATTLCNKNHKNNHKTTTPPVSATDALSAWHNRSLAGARLLLQKQQQEKGESCPLSPSVKALAAQQISRSQAELKSLKGLFDKLMVKEGEDLRNHQTHHLSSSPPQSQQSRKSFQQLKSLQQRISSAPERRTKGGKRLLVETHKVEALLETLRTTDFCGQYDPAHHSRYISPDSEPHFAALAAQQKARSDANYLNQKQQQQLISSPLSSRIYSVDSLRAARHSKHANYPRAAGSGTESNALLPPMKKIRSIADVC